MNSKNKTVILTMAMAVAFAVTGCGSKQSADTSPAVSSRWWGRRKTNIYY